MKGESHVESTQNILHAGCVVCVCVCARSHDYAYVGTCCVFAHVCVCVRCVCMCMQCVCVCLCVCDPEKKCHASRWDTNILQQKEKLWVTKFQQVMLGTVCR